MMHRKVQGGFHGAGHKAPAVATSQNVLHAGVYIPGRRQPSRGRRCRDPRSGRGLNLREKVGVGFSFLASDRGGVAVCIWWLPDPHEAADPEELGEDTPMLMDAHNQPGGGTPRPPLGERPNVLNQSTNHEL
ncbi:hypothetical protein Taro_001994 [Colocasia esculenta]|uniref:Uncharacterized protein n=1 Tax=Colocasia esculenta TaxID=4460 RepID=A0A843TJQ1_COLES|nr:hypothetical protein [Colocasia esculenta]